MFEASGMSVGQRSGWMWAVVVAVILVGTAWGQDPTKVEPKHYKLDFENDKVQVVSVHYGPHEKSSMHDHPGGVVVVVTGGHLKFTDENGKVTEVYAKAGKRGGSRHSSTRWRTWAIRPITRCMWG